MSFFPPLTPLVPAGAPGAWPTATPAEVGMDAGKLAAIHTLGDAVLIRHGRLFHATGNPTKPRGWASTARGVVASPDHAVAITMGLYPVGSLDRCIQELPSPTAQTRFPDGLTLAQALGYLSVDNDWEYSRWWRDMDDVFFEVTGRKMHDFFNQELGPLMPGIVAYLDDSDGTPRFDASPYDAARWGAFMLAQGMGTIDPTTFARATAPGPFDLEAWGGFHLVNHEYAWEDPVWMDMPHVPDRSLLARAGGDSEGAVCVVWDYDLIVAAKSGSHPPCDYLPAVCAAVIA